MKKRKSKKKVFKKPLSTASSGILDIHSELAALKEKVRQILENTEKQEDRLQDMEIHVNLLTRLLTTLCIEKFGMRIGVLKRLIKRIEKEAIRDSQILHLETLYKMPPHTEKKGQSPSKNDPWEEIS